MIVKELFVKLGVVSNKQDFNKAEQGMNKLVDFAKKAAVAFAGFKLGNWIKDVSNQVANLADQFDKMSARTGVAAQTLQQLGFAAELSGTNILNVEIAIKQAQKTMTDAAMGAATYADEYRRLGVSIKDSQGNLRSFEDLLPEISEGLQRLKTDTERSAVAQKLFGESGTQLLPLLKAGSENIRNMMQEFRELGGVIDNELQQQGVEYINNQARLSTVWQGMKNIIGKELLPIFNKLITNFITWFKENRKWLTLNIGGVFRSLGNIILKVSKFFGDIISTVVDWVRGLSDVEKWIFKITAAVAGLAIILSLPAGSILLLIGLIALLIEDFQTWKEGGESVIGTLIDKINEFLDIDIIRIMSNWWRSIKNMFVKAGQTAASFVLFFKDLFTKGISTAFNNIIIRWNEIFDDVWATTKEVFEGIWFLIKKGFSNLWGSVFGGVKDFLSSFWKGFVDVLDRLWTKIIDWSRKIVQKIIAPFKKAKEFVQDILGIEPETTVLQQTKIIPMLRKTVDVPTQRFINRTANSSVNVTVNASPGMNEEQLARKISRNVRDELDKVNRATLQAFVPGAS